MKKLLLKSAVSTSPSCYIVQLESLRGLSQLSTYTFNFGQYSAIVQVGYNDILTQASSQDTACIIKRDIAAGIDGLYGTLRVERRTQRIPPREHSWVNAVLLMGW